MSSQASSPDFDFILSQADGRPMYTQIMDQVQQRVAVGDWLPGTKLPSIRELAAAVHVSVITIKRAYLELERNGVIVTQQGKGSWVKDDSEGSTRGRLRRDELERHLERAATLAGAMGMSADELHALLERFAKD